MSDIIERVLTPLSAETRELFSPLQFRASDRLTLDLTRDHNYFIATTWAIGLDGSTHQWASADASRTWLARIPERKQHDTHNEWLLAATDFTAIVIHVLWKHQDAIVFKSDAARTKYNFLIARFVAQLQEAAHRGEYKLLNELPPAPPDFIDHPQLPLRRHQLAALFTTHYLDSCALHMGMGTGKTAVAVARICLEARRRRKRGGGPLLALIVAPKNVRHNWGIEFHRFATAPGKLTVLRGGLLARVKQITEVMMPDVDRDESMYSVVISSYNGVVKTYDALRMIPWDICVLDEAHNIKNVYAKRWKTFMRLRDICTKRMELTGTPITNSPLDLFPQLEFLGEGLSGFMKWEKFRSFYCKLEKTHDGRMSVRGYKNLPLMSERLARISFVVTKEEALPDLPPKTLDVIECEMGELQREIYQKVCAELLVEVESTLASDRPAAMTIENVLTSLLRLAQITAGMIRWDPECDINNVPIGPPRVEFFDDCPKLEALMEDIQSLEKLDKALVWCCFIPVVERISRRLTELGVDHVTFTGRTSDADRIDAVERFNNDPACKIFLGNPAAGGEGLNLCGYDREHPDTSLTNCCRVLIYAQNWSSVKRAQSEDRPHRDGTRVPVQVRDFIIPGTIEEEIRTRVLDMRQRALNIQDIAQILTSLRAVLGVKEEDNGDE